MTSFGFWRAGNSNVVEITTKILTFKNILPLQLGTLEVPMEWTKEIPMKIPIELLNKCTPLNCLLCSKVFDYDLSKSHYSGAGHLKKVRQLLNIGNEPKKPKVHQNLPKVSDKKCDACERKFASTEALKEHLRSAICYGDFKYECDFCDKRFSRKDVLNDHMYSRHGYDYKESWRSKSRS